MKPVVKMLGTMAVLLGMFMPMQAVATIEATAVEEIDHINAFLQGYQHPYSG